MTTFILALILTAGSGQNMRLTDVRDKFYRATTSEKICNELIVSLQPYKPGNNATLAGYRGAATMVMAKYPLNPFSKLNYFKKGRDLLEAAIAADRNNVELRFLRYSVQTNVPAILGYKSHLREDRQMIEKSLDNLKDPELKKVITVYFRENT